MLAQPMPSPAPQSLPAVPPDALDRVLDLPWMVHVLGVIYLVWIVAQIAPKTLGPLGAALDGWSSRQRRARVDAASDLRSQIATLTTDLREHRAYRDKHDDILTEHAVWDRRMTTLVIDAGREPPPRPPLWPLNGTAPEPRPGKGSKETPG